MSARRGRPASRHGTTAFVLSLLLAAGLLLLFRPAPGWAPYLAAWLAGVNGVAFGYYGFDKARARAAGPREPEAVLHGLALAGGALANSCPLAITRTHPQSPGLFAAVVSRPGSAKSPALKLGRRPFDLVQARWLEEWQAEIDAWEETKERGPRPGCRTRPARTPSALGRRYRGR
jgi:hypothetical protein